MWACRYFISEFHWSRSLLISYSISLVVSSSFDLSSVSDSVFQSRSCWFSVKLNSRSCNRLRYSCLSASDAWSHCSSSLNLNSCSLWFVSNSSVRFQNYRLSFSDFSISLVSSCSFVESVLKSFECLDLISEICFSRSELSNWSYENYCFIISSAEFSVTNASIQLHSSKRSFSSFWIEASDVSLNSQRLSHISSSNQSLSSSINFYSDNSQSTCSFLSLISSNSI